MIGKAIRLLRKKQKLSQIEVAKRANIEQCYLSQIETGKSNPSVEVFNRIRKAIGYPKSVFYYMMIDEEGLSPKNLVIFRTMKPNFDKFIFTVFRPRKFREKINQLK